MARYLYSEALAPIVVMDAVNLSTLPVPSGAAPFVQDELALVQSKSDRGARRITWQFTLSSNLTSITVELQGSIDGTKWFTIQSSVQTTAGDFQQEQLNVNEKFVRLAITALTAGAGTLSKGQIYQY